MPKHEKREEDSKKKVSLLVNCDLNEEAEYLMDESGLVRDYEGFGY